MKRKFVRITAFILSACLLFGGCTTQNTSVTSESSVATEISSTTDSSTDDGSSTDSTTSAFASSSTTTTTTTTEKEDLPESSDSTTTTTAKQEKPAESSAFKAEWKLSNTWEEGGKFCGGFDITITNNSGKAVESWTAEIPVPGGFEIISGWNAKYKVNGTKLTVTNESYNGHIDNGGSTSFGFNYSSPEEFNAVDIKFNGSDAHGEESPGNNNNSSSATTTATTKPVETAPTAPDDPIGTTNHVSTHGQLSVKGTNLVDKNGKAYQLKGMSTHGIGWFPAFVNENAFKTLRDDWNTNVVRLAMYTGQSEGYTGNAKRTYEELMRKGIDICIKLDMYVVVDWHVLADQSPAVMKKDALRFFDEISREYGKYPNIIYEICNEPNGYSDWADVTAYANEVIPIIRKNDPDSVIIVGTPQWCQNIDQAAQKPLPYDNLLYALHFYAATHTDWLRQRAEQCIARGLPLIVSEFGCCDASGNGANNFAQTKAWLNLLDKYNISYMNWNLANKNETSSAFKESTHANGNWKESEMNEGAIFMRKWFRGEIQ